MRIAWLAIMVTMIGFNACDANAAPEQARRVPATELEKNGVAYKGQRISLDEVSCAYVQGVYACFHQTAKLIVIASARPASFQEYVERGCGTTSSDQNRCITAITFQADDVRWEARPGEVRTAIIASRLELAVSERESPESTIETFEGALPIRANEFAEKFNKLADDNAMTDLRASLTQCERTARSTLCRYRIGEHSVLTMVASAESSRSNELALTSSIDTLARQQMVKTSMQLVVELLAPREYPEVKAEALSALLRKADEVQRHPRRAQLVTQPLGPFELLFYQDLQGQVNFNVRKK